MLSQALTSTEWGHHTAKINSVAWAPDSRHLATGSLDTSIIIWSTEKRSKTIIIKGSSIDLYWFL